MPKIPTYQRQYSPTAESPNAMMDVGSAGVVGRAVQGLAQDTSQAVNLLAQNYQRMEDDRARVDAVTAADQFNRETVDLLHNPETGLMLRKERNAVGLYKEFQGTIEGKKNEILKGLSPRAYEYAKPHITDAVNARLREVATHEGSEREKDRVKAFNDVDANSALNVSVMKPVDVVTEIEAALQRKAELSPTGLSEVDKVTTKGKLAYIAIQSAINNGDVNGANALMEIYKEPLDALKLRDDLISKVKVAQKDADATGLVVGLRQKYGDDLLSAIKEANDPKFIETHGLDVQQKVDAALVTQYNRNEIAYRDFSEDRKGKIYSEKIGKGIEPSAKDKEGLRSSDQALVDRWWRASLTEAQQVARIAKIENNQIKAQEEAALKEASFEAKHKAIMSLTEGKILNQYDLLEGEYAGMVKTDRNEVMAIIRAVESDSGFKDIAKAIGKFEKNKYFSANKNENASKALEFITETRRIMFQEKLQGDALVKRIQPLLEEQKRTFFTKLLEPITMSIKYKPWNMDAEGKEKFAAMLRGADVTISTKMKETDARAALKKKNYSPEDIDAYIKSYKDKGVIE